MKILSLVSAVLLVLVSIGAKAKSSIQIFEGTYTIVDCHGDEISLWPSPLTLKVVEGNLVGTSEDGKVELNFEAINKGTQHKVTEEDGRKVFTDTTVVFKGTKISERLQTTMEGLPGREKLVHSLKVTSDGGLVGELKHDYRILGWPVLKAKGQCTFKRD